VTARALGGADLFWSTKTSEPRPLKDSSKSLRRDPRVHIFARATGAVSLKHPPTAPMAGEGGLIAAAQAMDGKTLIGFIIAFCLASVISSRLSVRLAACRSPVPRDPRAFIFARVPDDATFPVTDSRRTGSTACRGAERSTRRPWRSWRRPKPRRRRRRPRRPRRRSEKETSGVSVEGEGYPVEEERCGGVCAFRRPQCFDHFSLRLFDAPSLI